MPLCAKSAVIAFIRSLLVSLVSSLYISKYILGPKYIGQDLKTRLQLLSYSKYDNKSYLTKRHTNQGSSNLEAVVRKLYRNFSANRETQGSLINAGKMFSDNSFTLMSVIKTT